MTRSRPSVFFVMRDMTQDSLEEFYAPTVANFHAALDPEGTPYAGPYRLVYIETSGDWKWKKEAHRLPWHYNMRVQGVCHNCQATGAEGDMSYKDFSDDAPHLVTSRTHAEYLSHFYPRPPPVLATLPGFDVTASLVGDWQHEVCLGIAQVAAGSCFADMLDTNFWEAPPGPWKEHYSVQLRIATAQFKAWCKKNGTVTSQPAFTVNRLNLGSAKSDEPLFKRKAANCMAVVQWLADVTREDWDRRRIGRNRAIIMWGLADTWYVLRTCPTWLTMVQRERLKRSGRILLRKCAVQSIRAKNLHTARDGRLNLSIML